jgi:hypothetical protein
MALDLLFRHSLVDLVIVFPVQFEVSGIVAANKQCAGQGKDDAATEEVHSHYIE